MLYIAICDNSIEDSMETYNLITNYFYFKKIEYKITFFNSGTDLLQNKKIFDIIFIDIVLENKNGIQIISEYYKLMRLKNIRPLIILLSRSQSFLAEGYRIKAFRYILKPIDHIDFKILMKDIIDDFIEEKNFIRCDSEPGFQLYIKNIIYAEIVKRKTIFYTLNDKFESNKNMNYWYHFLQEFGFEQIYKGILVHLKFVMKYDNDNVYLINGIKLPLSRFYRKKFKLTFKAYIQGEYYEIPVAYKR